MTVLLPSLEAARLRQAVTGYLTTTFALTDDEVRASLEQFLTDPEHGVFRGPYVRVRLPFHPAPPGWEGALDWYPKSFVPYQHQATAFRRLASRDQSPQPTLVTTGTGSGKTESFLIPTLDHVRRRVDAGERGVKALVLYPMNALANDQAGRLARLISDDPRLHGITAALYTGDEQHGRTTMGPDGLITDRQVIRSDPPDILLTNYKMLDLLLLRAADAPMWSSSRGSLRYLVLDEFHTYDGAQGTDVAMLLRRLGLVLGVNRPGHALGDITPVATSATLGDAQASDEMIRFAGAVFGRPFDAAAIVTEHLQRPGPWLARERSRDVDALDRYTPTSIPSNAPLAATLRAASTPLDAARTLVRTLWVDNEGDPCDLDPAEPSDALRTLVADHPWMSRLIDLAARSSAIDELARALFPEDTSPSRRDGVLVLDAFLAVLSLLRQHAGREHVSVEVHLWVREPSRLERTASSTPAFCWTDDGPATQNPPSYPAIYCRHCGRSGWGVTRAHTGRALAGEASDIRQQRFAGSDRFRALIYAGGEGNRYDTAEEANDRLRWLDVESREIAPTPPPLAERRAAVGPGETGDRWVPVLLFFDDPEHWSLRDRCPACEADDGIRFLGSSMSTLSSVAISALFSEEGLDGAEKKTLMFTDSVQDAAYRAGFVEARSHTVSLRSAIRGSIDHEVRSLPDLAHRILDGAVDETRRFTLVHPALLNRGPFRDYWAGTGSSAEQEQARAHMRRRLDFDLAMEFGLNSRTGRTLELTGSVAAEVAAETSAIVAAARAVFSEPPVQASLALGAAAAPSLQTALGGGTAVTPEDPVLARWVRGVVERLRTRGALLHPWFDQYLTDEGSRWSIWGGRPRGEGMPAFPTGRPAPSFAVVGATVEPFDSVTAYQSWYVRWTARALGVTRQQAGFLNRALFERLAAASVLESRATKRGAFVYALDAARVVVTLPDESDLHAGQHSLRCDVCQTIVPGSLTTVAQLRGGPCLAYGCVGHLQPMPRGADYYRTLYASQGQRRVVARDHTALIKPEERIRRERGFREPGSPADPNVLVATPTLELGIDIGTLSTVTLSGLPRTVASYLQRSGRAGRRNGSALVLSYVHAAPLELTLLARPADMIRGEVRAPATYLDAPEILQRQYIAHVLDCLAMLPDAEANEPRNAAHVLQSMGAGSFFDRVVRHARDNASQLTGEFLDQFGPLVREDAARSLRTFGGEGLAAERKSGLELLLQASVDEWNRERAELVEIQGRLTAGRGELVKRASAPSHTDEDLRALRASDAEQRHALRSLSERSRQYWLSALEERGILPNYLLLDDNVTLDVGLHWIDEETNQFHEEGRAIGRGSRRALTEFAPGATFYTDGIAVAIDRVNVGSLGTAIEQWRLCARCGWVGTGTPTAPVVDRCPRCGDDTIRDAGQVVDALTLREVSAEVSRDDAVISDATEDRIRTPFSVALAGDNELDDVAAAWQLPGYPFGTEYVSHLTIRWLNMGRRQMHGQERPIAGDPVQAPLFRTCPVCGIVPEAQVGTSGPRHRAWCVLRDQPEDDVNWRSIALTRTLRTQGVRVLVPPQFETDAFAVTSLRAALRLGLQEEFGGDPVHLAMAQVNVPCAGADRRAILLHDSVPGGTGYLAEFARPDRVRVLLERTRERLRTCPCQEDGRLACHRCLLPFVSSGEVRYTSRERAFDVIDEILAHWPPGDAVAEVPSLGSIEPPERESYLERRFKDLFVRGCRDKGWAVGETPTAHGLSEVDVLVPGNVTRRWRLTPQWLDVDVKPDFLLRTEDPETPDIVVFVDGWRFHASPESNRLADDATKRAGEREAGTVVWAITAEDLDRFEAAALPSPPTWMTPAGFTRVKQHLPAGSLDSSFLEEDALHGLLALIERPDPLAWRLLASTVGLAFADADRLAAVQEHNLGEAVRDLLDYLPLPEGNSGWWWRSGSLALACDPVRRGQVLTVCAIAIDDRPKAIGPHARPAWQAWLGLSNILGLAEPTPLITTHSLLQPQVRSLFDSGPPDLAPEWQELRNLATTEGERTLIEELARIGIPVPVQGEETDGGIPIDLAWPDLHVGTFVSQARPTAAGDAEAEGWTIVAPGASPIVEAIRAAKERS